MITFELILVFTVIVFILVSLYKELLGASFTFMVAVVTLGFFGVLTPREMLSGFANEQIAVIIMLLLLGNIIRKTPVIEIIFDKLFRKARSYKGFMRRMILLVSGFSALLNNTPLVAVMMPYMNTWCKRNNISPSKLLMPLSFAAILGGCVTLIGTSTNLIVNGLLIDQEIIPDLAPLRIFDFAWVGVPMAVIGFFYLYIFGEKLLPSRPELLEEFTGQHRTYLVETVVRPGSSLVGKTIEESGLRNIRDLHLVEIVRKGKHMFVVSNSMVIEEEDMLVFAGDKGLVADLMKNNMGLTLPSVGMLSRKKHTEVVEIVISHNSNLINKSLREVNFRAQYDAAVIAIHRNEERITSTLRDVRLKAGDVLLLFGGSDFLSRAYNTQDFYFISTVKQFEKLEDYKVVILLGGLITAIILSALNVISLFMGLLILLLLSLALKMSNPKDLPKAIDYDLALIIVMSLALGTAMIKSGAASLVADMFIAVFTPLGNVGVLFGIYLVTTILAALITNKAAVALIFPISLTISVELGLDPFPFVLVVAYASAANFMTPHGYQTNLMVYGPGGYTYRDFFRVGAPLTFLYMVVTVTILSLIYF